MLQSESIRSGQLVLVLFPCRIERKDYQQKFDYNLIHRSHTDRPTRQRSIDYLHLVAVALLKVNLQKE